MKLIILLLFIQVLFPCAAWGNLERNEPQAVFSHEDVYIEDGRTVGRLLAAGGNVVVDGQIKKGIIAIDGDVTINEQAQVEGLVLILGGTLTAPSDKVLDKVLIVPSSYRPMAGAVVGALLATFLLVTIAIPLGIWLFFYFIRDTKTYRFVKKQFFMIQHKWSLLYLLLSLFISGLMLATFAQLAWETLFRDEMKALDNGIIWLVRYHANADLDKIMVLITNLGYGSSYLIIVVITFVTIAVYKRWRELAALAICLTGGALLNSLLKLLFARSRPDLLRVVEASGYSFPSGHAMVSLCFYGMLAYLLVRNIKRWRVRYVVIVLAFLLVVAIGISRIYLGVHYPTDVLAGYAAGSMWLALCISLLTWWERGV